MYNEDLFNRNITSDEVGLLQIEVFGDNEAVPINNATIEVMDSNSSKILMQLNTNEIGKTKTISLPAPPLLYSMEQEKGRPFNTYNLIINKDGFEPTYIHNAQIFPLVKAIQKVFLTPFMKPQEIVIEDPVLWGNFPPKLIEESIKPLTNFQGFIVLPEVVIPEFIVVHNGIPNSNAINYKVPFKDYIKNVASCEIYSTWPRETIRANVLAIISFTLNRVYTEWYRSKGFDFTITNSTAYDQAYNHGRTTYNEINEVVDEVFTKYVTKPNIKQPLLTQYCDGKKSTCPNHMTQWGSKALGDQGYVAERILKYYYGNDIYLDTAKKVKGIPYSFNKSLLVGSSGGDVRTIQEQLNAISNNYPLIPKLKVNGTYDDETKTSVEIFQEVFELPITGVVNSATWYKISQIFVAVTKMTNPN